MKYTRNEFLKLTGIGLSGASAIAAGSKLTSDIVKDKIQFNLGLASYTFRSFSLDDTIKWALKLQLKKYFTEKHAYATGKFC